MRVLGMVRLRDGRPVWDAQECEGLQSALPEGVAEVWLPGAVRPVSPAVLTAYWARQAAANVAAVPSYDALIASIVVGLADSHGAPAALGRFLTCPEWQDALAGALASPAFAAAAGTVVASLRAGTAVYPRVENIFAALNATPLSAVRVVIVGQDPYHGTAAVPSPLDNGAVVTVPQAQGLSFSVPVGAPVPSSLRNIYEELRANFSCWRPPAPLHGCLDAWTRQGVLLLNASLTVEAGKPNSHAAIGWADFTDAVLRAVSERCTGVVFLLWGAWAKRKAALVDAGKHTVVTAVHPSGLSAHRGFLGSRCFVAVNRALAARGHAPLTWRV